VCLKEEWKTGVGAATLRGGAKTAWDCCVTWGE
jgi:hypothetical protein